jgi:glutathionylspermidine synthase
VSVKVNAATQQALNEAASSKTRWNNSAAAQGMLKPMQDKLAEIQKQTIRELKNLKASEDASAKSHGGSTS